MRTVLFFRNYKKFTGGHLKVWDYFNHVLASPHFTPRVWFSEASTLDGNNPWEATPDLVVSKDEPIPADVFVVAGVTWKLLDRYPYADPSIPVINLVQHVRHAAPDLRLRKFLQRKAIRICVSEEVAAAIRATGTAAGPVVVIPNGIDLEDLPKQDDNGPKIDVLVAALKEPELGVQVARRLAREGRRIELLTERITRTEFLRHIQDARVTVFLPHETEGFFLPALEGMALGTIVVCPDCIGNRSFCLPSHNSFRPNYVIDDVVRDAEAALALPADQARQLRENGRRTADLHSLARERQAFLEVLSNIDQLWGEVVPGRSKGVRDNWRTRRARRQAAQPAGQADSNDSNPPVLQ